MGLLSFRPEYVCEALPGRPAVCYLSTLCVLPACHGQGLARRSMRWSSPGHMSSYRVGPSCCIPDPPTSCSSGSWRSSVLPACRACRTTGARAWTPCTAACRECSRDAGAEKRNKKGKKDMAEQKWYETTHRWCQTNLTEIDAEICDIGFWK